MRTENPSGHWGSRIQRYILAGILTVIPLWVTWLVFTLIIKQLSSIGKPWVAALSRVLERYAPSLAGMLLQPWFEQVLAILLTIITLYLLGWAATRVVGRRIIALFDELMHRIPLVQTIYGGTKKMLAVLQQKPSNKVQRVVLIDFPSPEMKAVGFVTRVLTDKDTGQELAAVYVPTTPNPTSGYLEIVPVERVISTDWTMDQAMSFVISGGAIAPEAVNYARSAAEPGPVSSPSESAVWGDDERKQGVR